MLIKVFSYIVVMTVALSIYGLFTIKDKVASLHYQIETVSKQLIEENNMLHILKAEQAYLTSPVRLRKLSSLYLQLDTIKISQMVSDPSLPEDGKHLTISGDNLPHISKTNTKWRYKTNYNNKYITPISTRKAE